MLVLLAERADTRNYTGERPLLAEEHRAEPRLVRVIWAPVSNYNLENTFSPITYQIIHIHEAGPDKPTLSSA